VTKAVGRAAFVAAATAATGGVAGELVAGASEGMGLASEGMGLASGVVGRGVTAVASGATAGGFGNVAGHFIGEVYDQVLEAARSVGVGVGVKLQTTVRDFLDMLGGPPAFRFAYAGRPAIPARLASAPPTAPVWIVVRPLKDLNAPMKMEGSDHGGALGEIESVEPGEEIAAMFDEFSSPERHRSANASRRPGVEEDEELSEFDDGYQIKSDRATQNPHRPTWQESEQHVTDDLDWADFNDQRSFVKGKEVPRGTRGSTRPDNYSETFRLSVDVKNHGIERKVLDAAYVRIIATP
jgi:hypothetical protein